MQEEEYGEHGCPVWLTSPEGSHEVLCWHPPGFPRVSQHSEDSTPATKPALQLDAQSLAGRSPGCSQHPTWQLLSQASQPEASPYIPLTLGTEVCQHLAEASCSAGPSQHQILKTLLELSIPLHYTNSFENILDFNR